MKQMVLSLVALCLLLVASGLRLTAQTVRGFIPSGGKQDTIAYEVFDGAKYRAFYRTLITPNPKQTEVKRETRTLLLIGQRYHGFLDYNNHQKDSIYNARTKEGNGVVAMGEAIAYGSLAHFKPYLIKGYPQRGAALIQDALTRENFRYTDTYPDFGWTHYDDTKTIEGIECKRATCDYRGRKYEAWYAPSIPISSGPYVFGGLPGLILHIADTEGHYSFTISGFYEVKTYDPIYLHSRNVVQTTREEVARTRRNLAENPALALKSLSGSIQMSPQAKAKIKPRPYNPIELE